MYKKLSFLILLIVLASCDPPGDYAIKIKEDKSSGKSFWSTPDFAFAEWEIEGNNMRDSIFWAKTEIILKDNILDKKPLGIAVNSFGAYEMYWDDVLLGTNGTPGQELLTGKVGETDRYFYIPNELATVGKHHLTMRISQYYFPGYDRYIGIYFGNHEQIIRNPLELTALIHILAGAFLITFLYYLLLFINDRKNIPALLFSISCLLFFMLIIMEYLKFYVPIHYSNFLVRLETIGVLTLLISFLIPFYFSIQFSIPWRKLVFVLYGGLLLFIFIKFRGSYDFTARSLAQSMWLISIVMVSIAAFYRNKGAVIVLIGLIASALVDYFLYYDVSLFLSFTIILLCMLYMLSAKMKEEKFVYEQSLIRSERLKNELLKKKIQPHFLMNTLTSLMDWVEESPKKSVQFIEALAEEFNMLNQIEDQTLIPITQEIALCKSLLKIMSYRKETKYIWNDFNIDVTKKIPPAVIHTLVENGITHCSPSSKGAIVFELMYYEEERFNRYELITIGTIRKPNKPVVERTGTKYIKSRLQESYRDQWQFISEATEKGWKNEIRIYR
ncbi:histidine kinase [Aquimarina algiphila]|uniref:histidine kinase n=1 Tax=Aquimarina algiphila TaxID=2047982 RepID=UPI00249014B8|nr:sensor histidine kinase [Aquimarina algiphila]